MTRLYYTAPSDAAFEDMKQAAMQVWQQYTRDPRYYAEKTGRIKDIKNVQDNFMYIFAMFDKQNQAQCVTFLNEDTKKALRERMIDGGNPVWLLSIIGL